MSRAFVVASDGGVREEDREDEVEDDAARAIPEHSQGESTRFLRCALLERADGMPGPAVEK
jgi:hypothetical protein